MARMNRLKRWWLRRRYPWILKPSGPVIAPLDGWYLIVTGNDHRMVEVNAGDEIAPSLTAPMWITHMPAQESNE
jgi:hypothetical protein